MTELAGYRAKLRVYWSETPSPMPNIPVNTALTANGKYHLGVNGNVVLFPAPRAFTSSNIRMLRGSSSVVSWFRETTAQEMLQGVFTSNQTAPASNLTVVYPVLSMLQAVTMGDLTSSVTRETADSTPNGDKWMKRIATTRDFEFSCTLIDLLGSAAAILKGSIDADRVIGLGLARDGVNETERVFALVTAFNVMSERDGLVKAEVSFSGTTVTPAAQPSGWALGEFTRVGYTSAEIVSGL